MFCMSSYRVLRAFVFSAALFACGALLVVPHVHVRRGDSKNQDCQRVSTSEVGSSLRVCLQPQVCRGKHEVKRLANIIASVDGIEALACNSIVFLEKISGGTTLPYHHGGHVRLQV